MRQEDTHSSETEERPGSAMALAQRGTRQTGVRIYHERLVLSLIRAHGSLPKAEIARLTGLSAQTVSVIVRQLERDQLLLKGAAIKGKVGQPSRPYSLNPDGAYSLGLKVGRRSGDLMLIGLDGRVRDRVNLPYHFPTPQAFLRFARQGIGQILGRIGPIAARRIAGLGIAAPFELWKWEEEIGAPHEVMEAWKDFNLPEELGATFEWPIIPCNDATAACAAELFYGRGQHLRDFAYIYVGYFIGGGLVINGHLYQGPTGNAGAFGSLPLVGRKGERAQLIRSASLYQLEKELAAAGHDPAFLWQNDSDWRAAGGILSRWTEEAASGIALACASIASVVSTRTSSAPCSRGPSNGRRCSTATTFATARWPSGATRCCRSPSSRC